MSYHKSTNIGIEIEICVEKKFYKSLKTSSKKNNSLNIYKYPSDEDPFRNNSNGGDSSNDSLNNIVLTTDSTCKCDNKIYTRAEINSPRNCGNRTSATPELPGVGLINITTHIIS